MAALLSMLLAGALAVVRVEARSAHARSEALKARTAVQSGLDLAAYAISTGDAPSVDGLSGRRIALNGYAVSFAPSEEGRKLDLNLTNEASFEGFFVFLGLESEQAQTLAARIADWRDPDDLARPNGAEAREYAAARNGETIGDRPFQSVQELKQVLGFPAALFDCAAPALTVFGANALPDDGLMTQFYGSAPFADQRRVTTRLGTAGRSASVGARFAVAVTAESAQGNKTQLSGLYRISGGARRPYEPIAIFRESVRKQEAPACL